MRALKPSHRARIVVYALGVISFREGASESIITQFPTVIGLPDVITVCEESEEEN